MIVTKILVGWIIILIFEFYGVTGQELTSSGVEPFIVGGEWAKPHEFPFLVAITTNGGAQCGGTLISSRWVLTASHCIDDKPGIFTAPSGKVSDPSSRYYEAEQVFKYISSNGTDMSSYVDLALIKLRHRVNFIPGQIEKICLKDDRLIHLEFLKSLLTVAGWGYRENKEDTIFNEGIVKTQLTLFDCDEDDWFNDRQFCMTSPISGVRRGSWYGDSGGPTLYKEANGKWSQLGVTIDGWVDANAHRSYHRKLRLYLPWIRETLGSSDAKDINC